MAVSISEVFAQYKEILFPIILLSFGFLSGGAATNIYLQPNEQQINKEACKKLEGQWQFSGDNSHYKILQEQLSDYDITATAAEWSATCQEDKGEVILVGPDTTTHEVLLKKKNVKYEAKNIVMSEIHFKHGIPSYRAVRQYKRPAGGESLFYTSNEYLHTNADLAKYEDYMLGTIIRANRCAILADIDQKEMTYYCGMPDSQNGLAFIKKMRLI